ncbi:ABC transporter permease [Helicobacter cholecystus]|uniref:ABC transporter permease n=1 Tax=Helicobacter cholecystus TaxID=45498 RepID=A0A3D8IYH7_9HELI|nr:methionine ABC transporter permease [Helicobacter cholecystus]RDU69611.1 ABC transporter permease [Helicobacter cholecystus]VEJ24170.1 ABC transporter permease protein [Helicobacter cholecystus]
MLEQYLLLPSHLIEVLCDSTLETLLMVSISSMIALFFGLIVGVILNVTKRNGVLPCFWLNQILSWLVNITRSFPFIILIILLLPLSKFIVGQSYGTIAAIVPLSLSAIPFVARLIEGALDEVDKGLIEATQSMGANQWSIICVMLSEAFPSILNAATTTIIGLIGYSAIAGAIGAGGLGDLAIRLGYQTFMPNVLFWAVIVIIVMVQLVQTIGDLCVKWVKKYR